MILHRVFKVLGMENSEGSDFSGDPFGFQLTLTILKIPACRKQNRGASGARRNSNFSCISDVLTSDAEGPADVVGAHIYMYRLSASFLLLLKLLLFRSSHVPILKSVWVERLAHFVARLLEHLRRVGL